MLQGGGGGGGEGGGLPKLREDNSRRVVLASDSVNLLYKAGKAGTGGPHPRGVGCLVGWLVGCWLVGCWSLVGWSVGWLLVVGWLVVGWLVVGWLLVVDSLTYLYHVSVSGDGSARTFAGAASLRQKLQMNLAMLASDDTLTQGKGQPCYVSQ